MPDIMPCTLHSTTKKVLENIIKEQKEFIKIQETYIKTLKERIEIEDKKMMAAYDIINDINSDLF